MIHVKYRTCSHSLVWFLFWNHRWSTAPDSSPILSQQRQSEWFSVSYWLLSLPSVVPAGGADCDLFWVLTPWGFVMLQLRTHHLYLFPSTTVR